MDSTAGADLAVRGREVVTSYLAGVDVAWTDEDEELVEILNGAGHLRRIRVSVTDGDVWLLQRALLDEEPEIEGGWWSFVRVRRDAAEPEVYLAAEDGVRELMHRLTRREAAVGAGTEPTEQVEPAPAPVQMRDEAVRVCDGDLRPLLRSWRELTMGF
ncbi:hypothetical protein [Georgenia alba]|uniref:Uncharacterized protein n=1 Tax=Georgenia alba TaxID=2233858 RepID=A0ABW2Q5W2_9MICO